MMFSFLHGSDSPVEVKKHLIGSLNSNIRNVNSYLMFFLGKSLEDRFVHGKSSMGAGDAAGGAEGEECGEEEKREKRAEDTPHHQERQTAVNWSDSLTLLSSMSNVAVKKHAYNEATLLNLL